MGHQNGIPIEQRHLSNLSNSLSMRYQREGKKDDLNQAIEYSEDAVDLKFEEDPYRAQHINNLTNALRMRDEKEGKSEDLK